MREFRLSVEMDRLPTLNATEQEQKVEVGKDERLLAHLYRGRRCGCKNCIGNALEERWQDRGSELPVGLDGIPISPFTLGKP